MFEYTTKYINTLSALISLCIVLTLSILLSIFNENSHFITEKTYENGLVIPKLNLNIPVSYEGYKGIDYATHIKLTNENKGNIGFDIYNSNINNKLTYLKNNDIIIFSFNNLSIEYKVIKVQIIQQYDVMSLLDSAVEKLTIFAMDNSRIIYIEASKI